MESRQIEDVITENVDDLIRLCITEDKRDDPLFLEGMKVKKEWVHKALQKYKSCAKLAYMNSTPAGLIQYMPHSDESIVEICCIFVPDRQNHRKGIGRKLVKALLEEVKDHFDGEPLALVTYAFELPGWYPQHEFYRKMGFKQAGTDPYLLYYPLQEGYTYEKKKEEFIPQAEDEGKALIFYDPSCPFCIYFNEKIKEYIKEVADMPIRMVDKFEDIEEVKRRGTVPFCAVNKKPIESFFLEKEKFQSEVRKALGMNIR